EVVRAGRPVDGVPLLPAGRDVRRALIAVEVLAEQRGVVAPGPEPGGDRRPVAELLEAAVWIRVAPHSRLAGVLAGQDGGAAGTAQGIGDEAVGERHAVSDQVGLELRHR